MMSRSRTLVTLRAAPMLLAKVMIGTLLSVSCLTAGDAPADLPALFKQQTEWKAALKGLHVRYRAKIRVDSHYIRQKLPALELYYEAVLETWISEDGKCYRYETTVDQISLTKARQDLAKAAGVPKVLPNAFPLFCGNRTLVRSRTRSEELALDSGILSIRWTAAKPITIDGDPPPPLQVETFTQPLLETCIGHTLTAGGIYVSGSQNNLFAPLPLLTGVKFSEGKQQVRDGSASLSSHCVFSESTTSKEPIKIAVELTRLGSEPVSRWFVERIEMRTVPPALGADGYTTIAWKTVPKAPFVAVPERIIKMGRGGRLLSETVAEVIEAPAALPKQTWTIDPLLAKSIIDETAGMEIEPAAP